MKKYIFMLAIFILFSSISARAAPETENVYDINTMLEEQIGDLGVSKLQDVIDDSGAVEFDFEEFVRKAAAGELEWDIVGLFQIILKCFFQEIYSNMGIMIQLLILILASALLANLQSNFGKGGVSEIAFFACYMLIVGVAVKGFMTAMSVGQGFVDNLMGFVQKFVPIIIALIAASGGVTSATAFQPVLLGAVQIVGFIIKDILMPLLSVSVALGIISHLSERFQVKRLVKLIHNIIKWTLGILMTAFVGVVSIQSITLPTIDGIATKTAKYAVGNFVPVVGKVLSDTVDMVIGYSVILKNSFGVVGIIALIVICFVPIVKIVASASIFSITAAASEPIADKRIVGCIGHLAESMTYLFVMILCLELMFLICSAIVIMAGSSAVVMGR